MSWKFRVKCRSCDFEQEVEPGFVNLCGEGMNETKCSECGNIGIDVQLNMGSDEWHDVGFGEEGDKDGTS